MAVAATAAVAICMAAPAANADTYSDLVASLVNAAPEVKAEHMRSQSAIQALKAENVPDNPEASFEHLWANGQTENRWNAGISQNLPWPGTFGARKKVIKAMESEAELNLASATLEARMKIEKILIDIIAAKKEIAYMEEIHKGMTALLDKYNKAWEHGETTLIDLNKMKIEVIQSGASLTHARASLKGLMAELATYVGDSGINLEAACAPLEEFPMFRLAALDDYMAGIENSPAIRALEARIDVDRRNAELAKASRLPGFSLGYNHAYEEGFHFNGFSVGLTLPVYSRKDAVSAANSAALATGFERISLRKQTEADVISNYSHANSTREQMNQLGPVVEGTNNLALLRKALDGGQLSLLAYLQEVNYFLEARRSYLAYAKEYALLTLSLSPYLQSAPAAN